MADQQQSTFAAANEAREKRVIQAILDFDWDDYGLNDMGELAMEVNEQLRERGESDYMDWAVHLAKAVMAAARPLGPGEVSN